MIQTHCRQYMRDFITVQEVLAISILCKIVLYDSCTFIDVEAVTVSDVILFSIRASIFDLTCFSTGGPATTVTWTRDSVTVTELTETYYETYTHEYAHYLTVIGRTEGFYTCTVANERPSNDSANITIQGNVFEAMYLTISIYTAPSPPSGVSVSQNGLNSLLVSWTSGEPAVTGYVISYQTLDGEYSGPVNENETATSIIITGLMTGATYSISIVAFSSTLNSTETTAPDITIGTGSNSTCRVSILLSPYI